MARTKSSASATKDIALVVETVVAPPVAVDSATSEKKPRAKAAKKEKVVDTAASDAVDAPATPEVVDEVAAVADGADKVSTAKRIADTLASLQVAVQARAVQDAQIKSLVSTLGKLSSRNSREEDKRASRKKSAKVPKAGGFNKPSYISDALADFIGQERGTAVTRRHVNKCIHQYAVDNNLRRDGDKRNINPDAKLCALFGFAPDIKTFGYFTMQSHLKQHYLRPPSATEAV
jgi:chromatin remodeling complex protein RSC6